MCLFLQTLGKMRGPTIFTHLSVTYQVGTHAWLMCFVLLLGCCLIPLFVNYFKDVHHTCPRCRHVLYIRKKTCCE
uniref:LITAF domain-containing protein n=1 Tax=Dicentrarchus labrax TaxID=13489 RepID=A0A8C4H7I1_DICLA